MESTSDDSIFIQIDNSKIKASLIDLNYEEQRHVLNTIKKYLTELLYDFSNQFSKGKK